MCEKVFTKWYNFKEHFKACHGKDKPLPKKEATMKYKRNTRAGKLASLKKTR